MGVYSRVGRDGYSSAPLDGLAGTLRLATTPERLNQLLGAAPTETDAPYVALVLSPPLFTADTLRRIRGTLRMAGVMVTNTDTVAVRLGFC
jgi:hypothetical protein